VIGVVYAVSSAGAGRRGAHPPPRAAPKRRHHLSNKQTQSGGDEDRVAALYALVGALHWVWRQPFFLISTDPDAAFRQGWRVRAWDFLFYATFGLVVTSSVRIAGVLLVFSYLIVPALAGVALGRTVAERLVVGWTLGTLVSVLGIAASATLDLPTGATVVCAFGLTLLAGWVIVRVTGWRLGAGPLGAVSPPPAGGK
jgi:zinc/manganese transport system permease protein